jgi:hypothetical protein
MQSKAGLELGLIDEAAECAAQKVGSHFNGILSPARFGSTIALVKAPASRFRLKYNVAMGLGV